MALQLVRDSAKPDSRPYEWSEQLESELMFALLDNPQLWASVGQHIDAQGLAQECSKTVLNVLQNHYLRFGRTPSSHAAFYAHLERLRDVEGKLGEAQCVTVADFLLYDAEMSVDDILPQAALHVRGRRTKHILESINKGLSQGVDISPLIQNLANAQEIGSENTQEIDIMKPGDDIISRLRAEKGAERATTGIKVVDASLLGGPVRGSLTTFGAGTGVGKSFALTQVCCANLVLGRRVVYIPTEMRLTESYARIIGWLIGLPEEEVLRATPRVEDRWKLVEPLIGPLYSQFLAPGTRHNAIFDVVEAAKKAPGFDGGFDVLIVDYGDRLAGDHSDRNSHEAFGTVWETIHSAAVRANAWAFTASQIRDIDDKKSPTKDDLAGSRKKSEISENVVIILEDLDDTEARRYHTVKSRKAPKLEQSESVLTNFEKCRISHPDVTFDHLFQ